MGNTGDKRKLGSKPINTDNFLARYGNATFRHCAELLPAIHSGACVLGPSFGGDAAIPCRKLLDLYRKRAAHLATFNTPRAVELRADVTAFVEGLERHVEQSCIVLFFNGQDEWSRDLFNVAIEPNSGDLIGCLRTLQVGIQDSEWEALWPMSL